MSGLPAHFVQAVLDVHGDAGRRWLDHLDATLEACAQRWDLRLQAPFELTYNYVAPAQRADGTACVLKLAPPTAKAFKREAAVLTAVAGEGAPALFEHDASLGAVLLERVRPGDALSLSIDDDAEATAALAGVLRRWWRPAPPAVHLQALHDLAQGFDDYRAAFGGAGPLPPELITRGAEIFDELVKTAPSVVLLHGDLHHGNVLRSNRNGWLAIDPRGIAGDAAYDCAPMLHNPTSVIEQATDLPSLLNGRIALLASLLDLDDQRITAWGFVQAVLSAVWSVEDHGEPRVAALRVAGALRPLLP
jgi:streptomycin 6-kinase